MNLEKMKKMAAGLEKFAGVLQKIIVICMIAVVCVVAVLTVANAVKPDILIGENLNTIDVGHITIAVEPERQPENSEILVLAWIALALDAVYVAGIWFILKFFRRILRPMKEGNPFSDTVSRDIRKIGWAVVGMGVISNLVTMLEIMVKWRMWSELMADSAFIRHITVNYTFDAGFLVIFAILMLVAWIFEYGAELQKLSDETL